MHKILSIISLTFGYIFILKSIDFFIYLGYNKCNTNRKGVKNMKTVYYELKENNKTIGKEVSYIKARKWADQKANRKIELKLQTVNQDYLRQPVK